MVDPVEERRLERRGKLMRRKPALRDLLSDRPLLLLLLLLPPLKLELRERREEEEEEEDECRIWDGAVFPWS